MSSPQFHYFWTNYAANWLWALGFFALGLILGWLLWNGRRDRLTRTKEANARLRAEYKELSQRVRENS